MRLNRRTGLASLIIAFLLFRRTWSDSFVAASFIFLFIFSCIFIAPPFISEIFWRIGRPSSWDETYFEKKKLEKGLFFGSSRARVESGWPYLRGRYLLFVGRSADQTESVRPSNQLTKIRRIGHPARPHQLLPVLFLFFYIHTEFCIHFQTIFS